MNLGRKYGFFSEDEVPNTKHDESVEHFALDVAGGNIHSVGSALRRFPRWKCGDSFQQVENTPVR